MAGKVVIEVHGIPELQKAFENLAGPVADKALTRGVVQAAREFQAAITGAAPVREQLPSGTALPVGDLKRNIQIRVLKAKSGAMWAFVEPSRAVRHVARFVEYGHELIKGGRKGKSGRIVGRVAAHPFVRPSFEASSQDAVELMKQTILDAILEEGAALEDEDDATDVGENEGED